MNTVISSFSQNNTAACGKITCWECTSPKPFLSFFVCYFFPFPLVLINEAYPLNTIDLLPAPLAFACRIPAIRFNFTNDICNALLPTLYSTSQQSSTVTL